MLWLGWVAWACEERFGERGRVGEAVIYAVGLLLMSSSFLFFAFVPLPAAYYPDVFFHRPEEFVPALFFLLTLIGYLHKGDWRQDDLEHWLVLSLIVGVLAQAVFMSRSGELLDAQFDIAHLLKKVSYLLVLVGLLISMFRLFRQADSNAIRLAGANQAKSRFVAMISHEIRNPLHAVRGSLGLLKHAKLEKSERELVQVGQDSDRHQAGADRRQRRVAHGDSRATRSNQDQQLYRSARTRADPLRSRTSTSDFAQSRGQCDQILVRWLHID